MKIETQVIFHKHPFQPSDNYISQGEYIYLRSIWNTFTSWRCEVLDNIADVEVMEQWNNGTTPILSKIILWQRSGGFSLRIRASLVTNDKKDAHMRISQKMNRFIMEVLVSSVVCTHIHMHQKHTYHWHRHNFFGLPSIRSNKPIPPAAASRRIQLSTQWMSIWYVRLSSMSSI